MWFPHVRKELIALEEHAYQLRKALSALLSLEEGRNLEDKEEILQQAHTAINDYDQTMKSHSDQAIVSD